MKICEVNTCTGCGMCSNLCPVSAITMEKGENDFVFPKVDESLCIKCNLCANKCPANQPVNRQENVINTFAAWNRKKDIRKKSSSGGVFSAIAEHFLKEGGLVVGVAMINMEAKHLMISDISQLSSLNGSKYVQSNTADIYKKVKESLLSGKKVLFSGTPCQNHALKQFLGRKYDNLFLVDVVCHGVPSISALHKHIDEISNGRKAQNIRFRYKDPYWDYSFVRIDYEDSGIPYQRLTVDDDYLHLFNISYLIRNSCHKCHYANTHRQGDITLADFWGYRAHSFKMNNYFGGVSLVLVNTEKGQELLEYIQKELLLEPKSLEQAKRSQKCLSEPFSLPEDALQAFWADYRSGMPISKLSKKHYPKKLKRPKWLPLRHLKARCFWIIKKPTGVL